MQKRQMPTKYVDPSIGLTELMQEEVILPAQFRTRAISESPERRLVLGILVEAIRSLRKTTTYNGHADPLDRTRFADEARAWFCGAACMHPIFSFESVCDVLGLSPDYIRRMVLKDRVRTPKLASGRQHTVTPGTAYYPREERPRKRGKAA